MMDGQCKGNGESKQSQKSKENTTYGKSRGLHVEMITSRLESIQKEHWEMEQNGLLRSTEYRKEVNKIIKINACLYNSLSNFWLKNIDKIELYSY